MHQAFDILSREKGDMLDPNYLSQRVAHLNIPPLQLEIVVSITEPMAALLYINKLNKDMRGLAVVISELENAQELIQVAVSPIEKISFQTPQKRYSEIDLMLACNSRWKLPNKRSASANSTPQTPPTSPNSPVISK